MIIEWMSEGSCTTGHDPDLWWAENRAELRKAAAICEACPVLNECRNWALKEFPEPLSSWYVIGGMTKSGVNKARREAGITAPRDPSHVGRVAKRD